MHMYYLRYLYNECVFLQISGLFFYKRNYKVHNKQITTHVKVLKNTENEDYQLTTFPKKYFYFMLSNRGRM